MYGLLVEAVVESIKKTYGASTWEQIKRGAKLESQIFSTHQQYSEALIQRIVKTTSIITGSKQEDILDMLGAEFVNYMSQFGYDRILRVLGRDLRDFLNGLDNLHEYMRFSYPKIKPPSFFVSEETENSLVLHYRSKRKGYVHYVKGQIKQVGKLFYKKNVEIDLLSEREELDLNHAVFLLKFENKEYQNVTKSSFMFEEYLHNALANLSIKSDIFFELFPFHIVFKRNLEIMSIGDGLKTAIMHAEGESMKDVFNLVRPLINFTWDNVIKINRLTLNKLKGFKLYFKIISYVNNVFEMTCMEPVKRNMANGFSTSIDFGFDTQTSDSSDQELILKLRGQMLFVSEWDAIIYLATPM
jgi:guanylate cyclase, other